jgi:DNA polymerase III subunit delta'
MPVMPWDLIGHQGASNILRNEIAADRMAHAYLFTGADGIGKRTLALQFACAIHCQNPPRPGDFCGECRPCLLFLRQHHPDLTLLQPESAGGMITVDAVRALLHTLTLKPLEARYRIVLIQDVHRANSNASNALLKTIEEPPPSAILLLTAETSIGLLPTVVSRCRVIALRPAMETDIVRALMENRGLDSARALSVARLAGGRPGWAFTQSDDPQADESRREQFEQWCLIFRQSRKERMTVAQEIASDRERASTNLRMWQAFSHDLMLLSVSSEEKISHLDFLAEFRELSRHISCEQIRQFQIALRRAEDGLDRNANARLAVEAAMLLAPSISGVPLPV